jgi:hypothetical protein
MLGLTPAEWITCRYGIAFWYGGYLVRNEPDDYTAGKVMNVIFGAIISGFSLGQAAPSFGAFATGRAAGYRLQQVIRRKPAIDVEEPGTIPDGEMRVRSPPRTCCMHTKTSKSSQLRKKPH